MAQLLKKPSARIALAALIIAMLLYLPTREFLKITSIMGVPLVFLMIFMGKQRRYSFSWIAAIMVLFILLGGYGYMLFHLPDKIEVRRITTQGMTLVANGKYDAAIAEYRKLEKLHRHEQMVAKVEEVEIEKRAHRDIALAQQLIKAGDYEEARKMLEAIPERTWAAKDAANLLKSIMEK